MGNRRQTQQTDILMKAIGQLFEPQRQPQPLQNSDLAQYILTHSLGGPSKTFSADIAAKQGADSEGPSLLSKTFDLLSTGLYGTTNVVNDAINAVKQNNHDNQNAGAPERLWNTFGKETGKIVGSLGKNAVGSLARGAQDATDIVGQVTGLDSAPLVGKLENKVESGLGNVADKLTPRMMGSDVLDKQFGVHNKIAKYGGGFAADVALDPITYVPGFDILSTLKKAKAAKLAGQGFRTDEMIAKDASGTLDDVAAQSAKPGINTPAPPDISMFKKPNIQTIPPAPSSELALGKSLIPSPTRSVGDLGLDVASKRTVPQEVINDWIANYKMTPSLESLARETTNKSDIPLHRGDINHELAVGDTFDPPRPLSFDSSINVAENDFARNDWVKGLPVPFEDTSKRATYTVVGEKNSLPTSSHPGKPGGNNLSAGQDEHLVRGPFKVVDKTVRNGLVHYTLEQLPKEFGTKPSNFLMAERGIQNSPQDLEAMKALRRSDNATRAANVRWNKPIDWHDIPNMTPEEKALAGDTLRQHKMAKRGVVSDGKGNISNIAATNVVEDIRNGITPRFGPVPPAAEGAAAERAIGVADKTAQNLNKASRKGLSNKILTPEDQTNLLSSLRNEAARTINEAYDARPKAVLNPKQEAVANGLRAWIKGSGKTVDKVGIQKELDAMVKAKTINKTDAKAIMREFHPPTKIENYAATVRGAAQANQLAVHMLKNAEDHLISQGIRPVYHNGMQVRLSEVLADVGLEHGKSVEFSKEIMDAFATKDPRKLTDPVVRDAVTKALARRSLSMSDMLSELSTKTLQVKNDVLEGFNYPTPVANHILDALPKQASDTAESLGATAQESKSMADHVKSIIAAGTLPEEKALKALSEQSVVKTLAGKATTEEIQKANEVIGKMIDETPAQSMTDAVGTKSIDGHFARFSTWYGRQAEIKRASQDAFLQAELNAGERGAFFRLQAQNFTPEQLTRGFNLARHPENLRLAQEGLETDEGVLGASNLFKNYFEWALGSTGFEDIKDLAGTVAIKSNMVMGDINKQLLASKSKFQFKDWKKAQIKIGEHTVPRDYSEKGVGWMQSWETHDPVKAGQDPLSFMYDIDMAMQRTVAEYATWDELARRFGAKAGDGHFDGSIHQAEIPHHRVAGYKFHPEIKDQMMKLKKDLETGAWMPSDPMMRNIIKATRVWKSSVTIYRPIHHIRNVIGDAFNMWLAGHNNPTAFTRAIKVLETQKPRYAEALKSNNIDKMKALIDSTALDQMGLLKEVKASDAIIKKGSTKLDSEQLWATGYKRGLFLKYNKIEDIFGQTPMGTKYGTSPEKSVMDTLKAPFGGRAHSVATHVSEHREHFVRMAHYIAAVEKKLPKVGEVSQERLNSIFDEAAHEVRKYHPDGSDLTTFEQKVRVVIPFYSWTRKEIPLLVQAMVERPAKLVAYPRVQRSIAGASGIDTGDQGMLDPYPNDQLFPDWIRASGIGPIGDPQSSNPVAKFWASFGAKTLGVNGPEGYVNINPSNPFNDVTTQLFGFGGPQDAMKANLNSLNPMLQIPLNLAFDKTFSGAPISSQAGGEGVTDYLLRQIPQYGEGSRLLGFNRNDKPTTIDKGKQNVLNFFTGAGILGSGPYQKSAEFEAKARAKNAANQ